MPSEKRVACSSATLESGKQAEKVVIEDNLFQKDTDESLRLLEIGFGTGLLAKERVGGPVVLDNGRLSQACGKDIVAATKKNRHLLLIPLKLQEAKSGAVLGTLQDLGTRNPSLYLDFPAGRLKLKGTLCRPKGQFLQIKVGSKQVKCEGIYDRLIIFTQSSWIGQKEDNPEELPLPLPAELERLAEIPAAEAEEHSKMAKSQANSKPLRTSQRTVTAKRQDYAEDSADEELSSAKSSLPDDRDFKTPRERLNTRATQDRTPSAAQEKVQSARDSGGVAAGEFSRKRARSTIILSSSDSGSDSGSQEDGIGASQVQSKRILPARAARGTKKLPIIDKELSDSDEDLPDAYSSDFDPG